MSARIILWTLVLGVVQGMGAAAGSRVALADDIAITGATVHVEPGKVIEGATVIIRGGTIDRVAPGARVPAGARVIDGKGKVVTAGLIDGYTRLGLIEVALEGSTREGSFGGGQGHEAIHAAYQVVDGYNPLSMAIPVARSGGVTSAVPRPEGGLIAGRSAWFSLVESGPGSMPAAVKAPLAMHATLGEGALGSAGGSRGVALMRLREVLADARQYGRDRRSYERNQSRSMAAGRLDLEALLPVLEGRIPLVVDVHRASDIRATLRLGQEFGLRLVIAGGTEAWMVAGELAAARVGVIIDPTDNLPESFDRVNVRDDLGAVLARSGVDVAISSFGRVFGVRSIRHLAGIAVAGGMSREQALAALTTVPARLYGVERGVLEAGAAADLVVWSGDPFEHSTRAEHVIISGKEQSTRSRQTLLLERYRRTGK